MLSVCCLAFVFVIVSKVWYQMQGASVPSEGVCVLFALNVLSLFVHDCVAVVESVPYPSRSSIGLVCYWIAWAKWESLPFVVAIYDRRWVSPVKGIP